MLRISETLSMFDLSKITSMEKLERVIFYTLEKTIKSYRQFAQKRIKEAGYSITIDQWLVLKTLDENPSLGQKELSQKVFKDNASVTRIIDLLVKSGHLNRSINGGDRRRKDLTLTNQGKKVLIEVHDIVRTNRAKAVEGIDKQELEMLYQRLEKITENCSS